MVKVNIYLGFFSFLTGIGNLWVGIGQYWMDLYSVYDAVMAIMQVVLALAVIITGLARTKVFLSIETLSRFHFPTAIVFYIYIGFAAFYVINYSVY